MGTTSTKEEKQVKDDDFNQKEKPDNSPSIVTRRRSRESLQLSTGETIGSVEKADTPTKKAKSEDWITNMDSYKEKSPARKPVDQEPTETATLKTQTPRKHLKNSWTTSQQKEQPDLRKSKDKSPEKYDSDEMLKVFNFEEDASEEEDVDPPLGKILELVIEDDDKKSKPCLEKDSGNGSERDEEDAVIEDLVDMDYMNAAKDSIETNGDIWDSINESLMDIGTDTMKATKVECKTIEKKDDFDLDLASTKKCDFDWADGLKDEFADDNTDIWASTKEMMDQISMSLEASPPLKPKAEQKTREVSPSRKSRTKRKRVDENIGNPDSGKENADGDNVEADIVIEPKKLERVLSPSNKRKKDSKSKSSRASKESSTEGRKSNNEGTSLSSGSPSSSKKHRSSSGSSAGKSTINEKLTKQGGREGRLSPNNHKNVQKTEPVSLSLADNTDNTDKTSAKSKVSSRKIDSDPQKKEKSPQMERKLSEETKSSSKSKSSKSSSTSKSKNDWSTQQTKTHPSTLVKYYDNEYSRLKSKEPMSKSRRPSK